jgi:5-methylcytosine-specific restriction protein A
MPRAAKVCSHCPNPMPCPVHGKKPWEGSTRRTELPPDWERRRRTVLARDEVCGYCTRALATEVHHTGDKHDHRIEKLAGICGPCHKEQTARQARAARVG